MPDQDQVLLKTKLHRPSMPHTLVERARLVEWLDQGIDHPLTLVVAPAGYGKTTLVATWLNQLAIGQMEQASCLPSAWLSLDENDSDLNVFLCYFIAAIRTIFSEACTKTLALLQARQQPSEAVLYTTFCNELAELPEAFILVLDDYHLNHGKDVHNLLSELTRHWPEPLHLVLISRIDPAIPVPRLRAKGMVREIRTQDLRFSLQEAAVYLSHRQFAPVDQAILHLADLSLRSAGSQEALLSALSSENANITGYLVDEVLVHCKWGIHRSPAMACCILIAKGYTLDEAIELVKRQRTIAAIDRQYYE